MFEPAAELIKQRPGARGVRRLGSHQAEQLALARRADRAADRAFNQRGILGEIDGTLGIDAVASAIEARLEAAVC